MIIVAFLIIIRQSSGIFYAKSLFTNDSKAKHTRDMIWIFSSLSYLVKKHLYAFYSHLDPVMNDNWPFWPGTHGYSHCTDFVHHQFIYALILFILCFLDGIFGMQ